jgi:hypothetical protein
MLQLESSRSQLVRRGALLLLLAAMILAIAPYAATRIKNMYQRGWHLYRDTPPPGPSEARLQTQFLSDAPAQERFDALFAYFAAGFLRHATPGFERVQYSGTGSMDGYRMNGLEGFARTAPLLAAWVHSGRPRTLASPDGAGEVDIVEVLKQGLLTGTDPGRDEYWGKIDSNDQRIVEAADIARILWLTRASLWATLTRAERERISTWLDGASRAATPDNNWTLFPIVVNLVLAQFEGESSASRERLAYAHRQFERYKGFYLESGWFFDPPEGADFYNAWSISYELFWIHSIDPSFDPAFIPEAIRQSADLTAHLIGPDGIPIMGRSSCYRTAVPAPIVAASLIDTDAATAGRAARAVDLVWRYFIARGSVLDGALTQGYFETDRRFLDRYSGTGSCQWGVRSLLLAYLHEPGNRFWAGTPVPLPVEIADYEREHPQLGWTVKGHRATGEIVIEIARNPLERQPAKPYTWVNRAVETVFGRPYRPSNHDVKYERRYYSSAQPFVLDAGESTRVSADFPGSLHTL